MKFNLRRQSSGKLYPYIEILAHLMLRGFFRKIHVGNRKGVPGDQPVLLAANHPTAFVDPCVLGPMLDPPLYNMTRGDIFKKPLFRKLMESLNMFPVFRLRDGYNGRHRNDGVFEFCEQQLALLRAVTIYVEGEHHLEKRVRPVKKGIVYIAFDTFEKHRLDALQIIPAGCNYVWGDRPRDEVMLQIGRPIFVRDYWERYLDDPQAATEALRAAVESGLKEVCFHLEDSADSLFLEQLLTISRSQFPQPAIPIVVFNERRFVREKNICDGVNLMAPAVKSALARRCAAYFERLAHAGLTDLGLALPKQGSWFRLLLFAAGFLPYLIGRISSLPLIAFAKWVTEKTVKKREFFSSVWMGAGFFGGIVYYLVWMTGTLIAGNPWWIALALALPALGWFSMFYRESWAYWLAARKAAGHPAREALLQTRQKLIADIFEQDEARFEGVQVRM